MGKTPKELLKKPKAQKKTQVLVTSDDFQEAADLEEETGGKWRAGDPAKSSRAFLRAIQIYNDGLQKHTKDFDLAYNKARLEFELSQQPALVAKLPVSLLEFLQQTLASHRYALRLDEESADILFNTAQVMISIAEYVTEAGIFSAQAEAVSLLREAIELLSACFARQEMLVEEQNANSMETTDEGVSLNQQQPEAVTSSAEPGSSNEESVSVQEYITPSDLLDTARSSLTAITLLISLEDPTSIPSLSKMGTILIDETIPKYLSETELFNKEEDVETQQEISLERATFISSLSNAEFRFGTINIQETLSRLEMFETLDITTNVAVLCTYADSLVEFVTTTQTLSSSKNFSITNQATISWTQLSKAQDLYNRAVKINNDEAKERKAQIYESRADVELLRFNLAVSDRTVTGLSQSICSSAPTLIKNAQTYYRGASNLFRNDGDMEASGKAEVRGLIAAVLEAKLSGNVGQQVLTALRRKGEVGGVVALDMMRESLLPENWDEGLA